ncbi:unnamed protein product [Blepharisma stoltei]|uniref:Uncharacterized protein n=1 Tax=Blepharisma stoltei TaxID=1481888 RepID=A0AAU9JHA3_9CILI|nr:unnamed protein product [Blepharisma stoltei]
MALKKELSTLFSLLTSKAQLLPVKTKTRALKDIQTIFKDYETIENAAILEEIKTRANNKLIIMEMSVPDEPEEKKTTFEIPGVKKFHVKDGKVVEGEAPQKHATDFSNWYAGNVDPSDLKRHKELRDRMCYFGPFWEGRKRNPSILDEPAGVYPKMEKEEKPPRDIEMEENNFELVKR